MVLESLLETESVAKHPLFALFLGFLFSSVSLWIAFFSFPASASILAISFITIAAVPLIHHVFQWEEEQAVKKRSRHRSFTGRNFDLIKIYAWFSLGIIAGYAIWYTLLPMDANSVCWQAGSCIDIPDRGTVFKEQIRSLDMISKISGSEMVANATVGGGICSGFWCWFNLVFTNNSSLMLLAVLLSFLFGAGALFLITWNASIVGVLIGQNIVASNHLTFLGLLPHGIPEFAGYFMGAISGGLISVALTKKKFFPKEFEIVAKDSLFLLIIALFSLLVGAAIEAFALIGDVTMGMAFSIGYILFLAVLVARTQL